MASKFGGAFEMKVSGPDIGKAIERGLKSEIQAGLRQAGRDAVKLLKAQSNHIEDLGNYRKGWFWFVSGTTIVIGNVESHAVYVENGRRPGATPPPAKALEGWCERHLGRADLAWAVARSIGKKGIRTRRVFTNPVTAAWMMKQIRIQVANAIDRTLSK